MLIRWLFNLFLGYVVLRADGPGVEKLLNLAISRGIVFWDVRQVGDKTFFKTYPDNFPLLRPLSRKAGCPIRIDKKAGFPFLFYRFKKRQGLVAGLIIFFLILYVAGNFIWFIEIKGIEGLEEKTILLTAEELGLAPGTYKRALDFPALERDFLLKRGELAWVGFQVQGTKLVIEVVEKAVPPPDFRDITSDLLAARDGLIEKVLVLSGEARVEEGDTVQEGQMLISGILTVRQEDGEEVIEREVGSVRARGEVWARVWYEFITAYPFVEQANERTGNRAAAYTLRFKDKEVRFGPGVSPYRNFEEEKIKGSLKWRNLDTPIEFNTIYYYELNVHTVELSAEEALYKAKEELYARAERSVPSDVEIVSHEVEELNLMGEDKLRLRLIVETRENIAEEKEHENKEE